MAEICDIKTIPLADGSEKTHGITVSVNTDDRGMPPEFVAKLAATIALHRMCSPPDTSVLVISVIGPFDADVFRREWTSVIDDGSAESFALKIFLDQMSSAVLIHGKSDGTILQEVPLASF